MKKFKYGSKILISIIVIVLLQVAALVFLFSSNAMWYSKEYKDKNEAISIENNFSLLEEWINQKESYLKMVEDQYSEKYSKEDIYILMGKLIENFPGKENDFISIYYNDINGKKIKNENGSITITEHDLSEKSFDEYSGEKNIYSYPYLKDDKEVITIRRVLYDKKHKIAGVINEDILMDSVIDIMNISEDLNVSSIVMANNKGKIVYSKGLVQNEKKILSATSYENIIELSSEIEDYYKLKNRKINNLGVNAYLVIPSNKRPNMGIGVSYQNVFAVFAAFVGFAILALITTKYLIKPINSNVKYLQMQFNKINGFYSKNDPDNELRLLSESFVKLDEFYEKKNEKQKLEIKGIEKINANFIEKNKEIEEQIEYFKGIGESIQITENMYKYLMNSIDEIIIVMSSQNKIEYVNNIFEKKLKEEAKNVIGKDIKRFFKEWNNEAVGGELFSKRDFSNLHVSIVNKEKSIEMPSIVDSKRIFRDNEIVAIQFIIKDISEEQKLYSQYVNKSRELMITNEVTKSLTEKVERIEILQTLSDKIYNLANIKHCKIEMFDYDFHGSKVESGEEINTLKYEELTINETLETNYYKNLEIMKAVKLKALDSSSKDLYGYYFPLKSLTKKYGILSAVLDEEINEEKIILLKSVANIAVSSIEKAILFEKLRKNYRKTVSALVSALEKKASIMVNHTIRVANYSILIGKKLYLTKDELDDLYIAGLLHDIGKIGIEDEFLKKLDNLTKEEYSKYGAHQAVGKKILDPIGFKQRIIDGIYYQEKNYDLSGYPYDDPIKEQPLFASIIEVANTIDSMLTGSEFSEKKKRGEILKYIKKENRVLFNPEITLVVEELFNDQEADIEEIASI